MGSEKKTLVEEARMKMKRARRKHKEALVEFPDLIVQELPKTVLDSAELNLTRIALNMETTESFKELCGKSKYFLLNRETLEDTEWKYVHDTVISRLQAEPDLSWKPFDSSSPQTLTLIWETV